MPTISAVTGVVGLHQRERLQVGILQESALDSIVAFAGGGQTNATKLTNEVNRVATVVTAGDSVMLPVSNPGVSIAIINSGANAMQVFGQVGDTVNDIAAAIGYSQPAGSTAVYFCPVAGKWYAISGTAVGGAGTFTNLTLSGLLFESAATGITAGTTRTQAQATVLTKEVSRVDTSTAPAAGSTLGDGVVLMTAAAGLDATVINNTANNIQVYGNGTDTINGIAGSVGVPIPPGDVAQFEAAAAGSWNFEAGVGAAGALPTQISVSGVTATGANQAGAFVLPADFNFISSTPAGTGVLLPVAKAGLDIFVNNHGGLPLQVYGNGTDTVDDIAGATGVSQMNRSVVLYTCYANGSWYTEGLATGFAPGGLQTIQFQDAITALGSSQATATPMTGAVNTISSAGAGTGVNLPSSFPGLIVTVINTAANAILVYPAQGAGDTINGFAAATGLSVFPGSEVTFNCTAIGAWNAAPASTKGAGFSANAATTSTTLTGANITGGVATVDLALTGTLAGAANATMPTVAQMTAAMHAPVVGTSYRLRIINQSGGAFTWTVVTNTGWTLTGTMTIAQNTWREFVITLNTTSTATLQNVATGTFS